MGFLDKLFGGGKASDVAASRKDKDPATCAHRTLVPRWDNAADMGDNAKVSAYACESCHQSFTPDQGRQIREAAGA